MKPKKVEFQAFGPYVGHESVDFDVLSSKGLFLICGKTGIGKTMILDAMTFALYGKSSGHGRDDFESMRCTNADPNKATFVRFEFENNGVLYRFERRLERKRTRMATSYSLLSNADGIWQTVMENAKDKALNEKAVEIIGLEYEQFRQVIVLPQGQFERLLVSNSDEKEKILTTIFGERKWQRIAEIFYDEVENRRAELQNDKQKIQNLLADEQCETIEELENQNENNRRQKDKLTSEFEENNYTQIIHEQQERITIASRFGDLHRTKKKLEELEEKKNDRDETEKMLNNAKRAGAFREMLLSLQEAKENVNQRIENELTEKESSKESDNLLSEILVKLKQHKTGEKQIEETKALLLTYEGKKSDYEGLKNAEEALEEAERGVSLAEEEEKIARREYERIKEKVKKAKDDYDVAKASHESLLNDYLLGITGELAAGLCEGEPCPVCGSLTHPQKALPRGNGTSKEAVDEQKKNMDKKYAELEGVLVSEKKSEQKYGEKHSAVEAARNHAIQEKTIFENCKKRLVKGIDSLESLNKQIKRLDKAIKDYSATTERLTEEEKAAKEHATESKAKYEAAMKETEKARKRQESISAEVESNLEKAGFSSVAEVERMMLSSDKMDTLNKSIAEYDADVKSTEKNLADLEKELRGKVEPNSEECQRILDDAMMAQNNYNADLAVLNQSIDRLDRKLDSIKKIGEGIEGRIREVESDYAFAKKLRGDSGTGLQRYVLGIMFSSVVAAANKMLELVHGGRYRLYRTDEKAQGTNKRGLELKVFDRNSGEHDGRFVSTLSGGEKFLVSLALSIGMSTIAQKSGIRIEALFIDEGFGSLDDDSINDAMSVLNSIQQANGMVGIISHVQILQDQIPTKLRVVGDERGSHIIRTVG